MADNTIANAIKFLKGEEKSLPAIKTEGQVYFAYKNVGTAEKPSYTGAIYIDTPIGGTPNRVKMTANADIAEYAKKANADSQGNLITGYLRNASLTGNADSQTFTFTAPSGAKFDLKLNGVNDLQAGLVTSGDQTFPGYKTLKLRAKPSSIIGSDNENSDGWYKVATSTMSGFGNTNILYYVKNGYSSEAVGILDFEMRSDNTSIQCWACKWLVRGAGFRPDMFRVVIDGMTWTLYVYQSITQWSRISIAEISNTNIIGASPDYKITYYNSTTKETTEPDKKISSSDGGQVYLASKTTSDGNGQNIANTYIKSLSYSNDGKQLIATRGSGDTSLKLSLPIASAIKSGIVTTDAQSFGGTKTFTTINSTNLTVTGSSGFNYSGIETATGNKARPVWFAYDGINGKPVVNANFTYNPATQTLSVANLSGTANKATNDSGGQNIRNTYISNVEADKDNKYKYNFKTPTGAIRNSITIYDEFQKRSQVDATTDWNTLTSTGIYKVQMSAWGDATKMHSPNSYNKDLYSFGILLVFESIANDSEKRFTQIYIPHNDSIGVSGSAYKRMHNGSDATTGWQSWHPIARGLNWNEITSKPSTFPPSPHTHNYAGSSSAGGAATSANKLTIARKISFTGSITGSASFDGSGDISIDTVTNHSHNQYLLLTGGTMTGDIGIPANKATIDGSVPYAGSIALNKNFTDFASYKTYLGSFTNTKGTWYNIISTRHRNGCNDGNSYGMMFYSTLTSNGNLLWNKQTGTGTWQGERTILDSSNYTDYAPTKIGSGASGTWNININGNAKTASQLATARTIFLDGLGRGSVSFDGSGDVKITDIGYGCTKYVTTNATTEPYYRIAYYSNNNSWVDASIVFSIDSGYIGGGFGIVKVAFRSNNVTADAQPSNCEVSWLVRQGFNANQIFVKGNAPAGGNQYADLYFKATGQYQAVTIRVLSSGERGSISRNWTFEEGASRKNADIRTYSYTVEASDVGIVKNSIKWNDYENDIGTNNTSDTWLLVANNNKIQHKLTTSFATSGHTHNYAGSASVGGSANSAVKLDSSAGSSTQPVYFSGGKPVACTYTLNKSVPADAKFTDTNTWRPLGTTGDTACAGNDSRLSNARPASDVYAWAKASTKPSYSWGEITNKPSTFTPSSHDHSWLVLSGYNTISSATNDTTANWGKKNISFHFYSETGQLIDQPFQYGYLFNVGSGSEVHQLWMEQPNGSIFHRGGNASGWSGTWQKLLDSSNYTSYTVTKSGSGASGTWGINISGSSTSCTGNAATATKLQTARTISLTGSVTGSGTFDGSGNLSITTSTNHSHSQYLPLAGGTMTGSIGYGAKGYCYVGSGTSDAANMVGGGLNNLVISSWQGISFTTTCSSTFTGKNAVSIDCRNGVLAAASLRVGNGSGSTINFCTNGGTAAPGAKIVAYNDRIEFVFA